MQKRQVVQSLKIPHNNMNSQLTTVVTTLALISNIAFVLGFLFFFTEKTFRHKVSKFVSKYVLELMLGVSCFALFGSLAYSNIIGFPPCELCWIQRIFMYPQVVLLFIAVWKKDKNIIEYLIPLSILGGIVALYHSLTHFGLGDGLVACTSTLGDCGKLYVFEYGYITIPFMSLTIFVYLLAISFIYKKTRNV